MKGYFKCFRELLDLDCFQDSLFVMAYLILLREARFMPTVINGIPVEAGQLVMSISEFADKLHTSKRTAQYILDKFKKIHGITAVNIRNRSLLITLQPLFLTGEGITDEILYHGRKVTNSLSEKKNIPDLKQEKNDYSPLITEDIIDPLLSKENESKTEIENISVLPFADAEIISDTASLNENAETNEHISRTEEKKEEEEQKKTGCYGKFRNVLLSEKEYEEMKTTVPGYTEYIEKFSAYLASSGKKDYKSHYAAIYSWYLRDKEKQPQGKQSEQTNDPYKEFYPEGRSYDLERAMRRSLESTPILKKRNRETGKWEKMEGGRLKAESGSRKSEVGGRN